MAILQRLEQRLVRMERKLNILLMMERFMGRALDDLTAAVSAQTTVGASVITLLDDITARLKTAVENDDSEAIDKLTAELTASRTALAAAVLANTPAAATEPPVAVPPPPVVDPGSAPQP